MVPLVPEVYFYYFYCEGERKNKPLEPGYLHGSTMQSYLLACKIKTMPALSEFFWKLFDRNLESYPPHNYTHANEAYN
jgi:hypothetical protein